MFPCIIIPIGTWKMTGIKYNHTSLTFEGTAGFEEWFGNEEFSLLCLGLWSINVGPAFWNPRTFIICPHTPIQSCGFVVLAHLLVRNFRFNRRTLQIKIYQDTFYCIPSIETPLKGEGGGGDYDFNSVKIYCALKGGSSWPVGEVYFLMMIPWCFSYYCLRCLGFSPCCSPFRCGKHVASLKPRQTTVVLDFPLTRSFSEPNKNSGKNGQFLKMTGRIRRFWNGALEWWKVWRTPKTNMDTQNCFIWNPCCFYSFLRRLLIVFHTPVGFLLPTVALSLRVCFLSTKSFWNAQKTAPLPAWLIWHNTTTRPLTPLTESLMSYNHKHLKLHALFAAKKKVMKNNWAVIKFGLWRGLYYPVILWLQ